MSCTLVLLPGMDGTGELFSPLLKELGPDIQTVVVRYPDLPLDYAAHEAFARARLPSTGPFVVLGESFSGPIAISLAASSPDGMCGYVLCASFVRSPRKILNALRPLIRFVNFNRVHPADSRRCAFPASISARPATGWSPKPRQQRLRKRPPTRESLTSKGLTFSCR